jgi:hypothetical protein
MKKFFFPDAFCHQPFFKLAYHGKSHLGLHEKGIFPSASSIAAICYFSSQLDTSKLTTSQRQNCCWVPLRFTQPTIIYFLFLDVHLLSS